MCLAIPGKIESVSNDRDPLLRSATVAFGGVRKNVNLCLVPDADIGDFVLVHVGIAISRIDEDEARSTLATLSELGEIEELSP